MEGVVILPVTVNAGDILRVARENHRRAAMAKATKQGWYYFEGGWRKVGDPLR